MQHSESVSVCVLDGEGSRLFASKVLVVVGAANAAMYLTSYSD